ncbi:MAG TPA: hypothetical protein VK211_09285, partial [Kamptonema sp.]|nr:hypothetical protein [Kamptonema sp.]
MESRLLILGSYVCLLSALAIPSGVFGFGGVSEAEQLNQKADIPQVSNLIAQGGAAVPIAQILPQLKGKTQVPIFLPSQVPFSQKLYFNAQSRLDGYSISIDYTANCRGTTACSAGGISAQKGGEFTQRMEGVTKTLKNIKLAKGIQGVFHNGCGAYCTASVEWKRQGVLYTVAIKNGR